MLLVIADDFGISSAQAGALTSAYFLIYTMMQLPTGVIGDRVGLKRLLVITYTLAGLGMLAIGLLSNSYFTLILAIAVHGLGAGAYYTAAFTTTMQTVPAHMRGISSAVINSGMAIGLALGLAMSGPVYLATGNWRNSFLLLAVPTLLMALVFALVLKDVRPQVRKQTPFTAVLKDRQLMAICMGSFCSLYGFFVVITWAPTFFQTERGLSLAVAGSFTAIVAVASLPSAMFLSRLSDKIGRKRLSLTLFPLASVSILAMANAESVEMLLAALLAYGMVGKLTWDPIQVAWLSDIVHASKPDVLGTAVGMLGLIGISAAMVGPILSGFIRDITGSLVGAFYLGAAIVMCGFFFAMVPGETVHRQAAGRR